MHHPQAHRGSAHWLEVHVRQWHPRVLVDALDGMRGGVCVEDLVQEHGQTDRRRPEDRQTPEGLRGPRSWSERVSEGPGLRGSGSGLDPLLGPDWLLT